MTSFFYLFNMKTYIQFYNHWKMFTSDGLMSLRNQIFDDIADGKQIRNADTLLRLEVIEDLIYLKQNNIPL